MPERRSDGVVIKWNKPLLVFGFIALRGGQYGIEKLQKIPSLEYDEFSTKLVVYAVYLIFCLLAFGIGSGALIFGCKRITFDEGGIRCSFFIIKREIPWSRVQSWGLTGEGNWFGEHRTWVLYVTPMPVTDGSRMKRWFLGRKVRIPILRRYAGSVQRILLPYCHAHLGHCPFYGDPDWEG